MGKPFFRRLFSSVFLSIFFLKMLICTAPFIIAHVDSKALNAVIMQLEIENDSEKSTEKLKESLFKEYCTFEYQFSFSNPLLHLNSIAFAFEEDNHLQTFYPSVPTPPPSA